MVSLSRLWLLGIACALALAFGSPPVRVDVSPRRAIGTRDIRITARVERHADNRLLVFAIDGTTYARQDVELNTDEQYEDARLQERLFRGVPPGQYTVTAAVVRAGGQSFRATSEFCLVGMTVSCD